MERARLRLFLEALPSRTDKFEYREPRPPSAPYPKLPPTSEVLSHKQVQSFEGDESYLAGIQKQLEALSSEVGLDLTSNSIHSYVMAWANDESRKSHQDYSEGLSDDRNIFPRQIDVDSFLRRVRDFLRLDVARTQPRASGLIAREKALARRRQGISSRLELSHLRVREGAAIELAARVEERIVSHCAGWQKQGEGERQVGGRDWQGSGEKCVPSRKRVRRRVG